MLTVVATIIRPLTLVVGVFGMNFAGLRTNVPELGWGFAYPAVMLGVAGSAFVLLVYVRQGGGSERRVSLRAVTLRDPRLGAPSRVDSIYRPVRRHGFDRADFPDRGDCQHESYTGVPTSQTEPCTRIE